MITEIIDGIGKIISSTLGKLIKDKDLSTKLEAELRLKLLAEAPELIRNEMMAKKEVLIAEIGGESWMQRNWRPILMLTIVAIVANNYIISPYLQAMFSFSLQLQLPPDLWELMKLGTGGYIIGRSGEKMLKTWKDGE